ncbi:MAG: hypothetical protein U0169_07890 [Polyangiaceae bacterium]
MPSSRRLMWVLAAASLAVACSEASGTQRLGADPTEEEDPGDDTGSTTRGGGGSSGSSGTGGSTGASTDGGIPPRADSGPGSTASAARDFFIADTSAKLNASCGSCHIGGANGAPKFLASDAAASYIALDNRALIQAGSLLTTKGVHSNGGAPALSGDALASVTSWLGKEAGERAGKAAPVSLLEIAAKCGDMTKFPQQALTSMLTTQRQNENNNNCTGCSNTQCASCHNSGEANTYIANPNEANSVQRMLAFYQSADGISRFVGIDGTKLVESKIFETKATATQADQRSAAIPKHPMYRVDATRATAIAAFAADIVAKYNAGTCPNQK